MRSRALRHWAIAVALLAAAAIAAGLKPTHRLAEEGPRVDLERLIPGQFGGWRIGEGATVVEASPDVQARLDRLYDQVLSRTYVDGGNRRVMLSIAYGGDQRNDRVQAHRPEYCYAAQGFLHDLAGLLLFVVALALLFALDALLCRMLPRRRSAGAVSA